MQNLFEILSHTLIDSFTHIHTIEINFLIIFHTIWQFQPFSTYWVPKSMYSWSEFYWGYFHTTIYTLLQNLIYNFASSDGLKVILLELVPNKSGQCLASLRYYASPQVVPYSGYRSVSPSWEASPRREALG